MQKDGWPASGAQNRRYPCKFPWIRVFCPESGSQQTGSTATQSVSASSRAKLAPKIPQTRVTQAPRRYCGGRSPGSFHAISARFLWPDSRSSVSLIGADLQGKSINRRSRAMLPPLETRTGHQRGSIPGTCPDRRTQLSGLEAVQRRDRARRPTGLNGASKMIKRRAIDIGPSASCEERFALD